MFAQAADFHPDAVYRINIDNDGDAETDVALSFIFSKSQGGRQSATAYLATGPEARSAEAVGMPIITDAEVSFGPGRTSSGPAPIPSWPGFAATPSSSTLRES